MSTLQTAERPPSTTPTSPVRRDGGRRRLFALRPGWPLFALFGGFPIWWVLGIGEFAPLIFSLPMAMHLLRQRHVYAPRGLGVWLLFVVWVVGGVVVLQVHAPGTIAADSSTRYITFGYRLLWYTAATVVLLYVGNTRKQISNRQVCLALSYMFVVVTAGGLLGVLAPHLEFRSALEYVLPHGVSNNPFVHGLIHPISAQVEDFLGYAEARPSAPFAFTNEWGLAIACFLPFFVVTWFGRDAGWRRFAAPVILLLATIATVYSLNRGLWLALLLMVTFVAVRYALMGKVKLLALLGFAAVVAAAVIAFSPLGHLLLDRLAHPHSNQGRTNLGTLTLQSVTQGSPVMGFGSTRNVQGNFSSIAAAASSQCPGCSPPPLGTQGHLWLVVFSEGYVGLALYLGFFVTQFLRHLRLTSPYVIAALAVVLVHLVTMPVYDSIGPAYFAIMIAVGMLWRGRADHNELAAGSRRAPGSRPRSDATFATYPRLVRRHAVTLAVAALLGGLAGGAYQAARGGSPSIASQSILIPADQTSSPLAPRALTIDTDAKLITAGPVLNAVAAAIHPHLSLPELATRFQVTASPNTNILNIAFTADNALDARRGIAAATKEYFALRQGLNPSPLAFDAGQVVQATSVKRSHDGWVVSVATGAMGALGLSLVLWWLWGDRLARVGRRRATSLTDLPVLGFVKGNPDDLRGQLARMRAELARQPPLASVLAVRGSAYARKVARLLETELVAPRPSGAGHAVLVASTRTRAGEVVRLHKDIAATGQHVLGIVLVKGP
ncbi:MAG: hypothetical protein ACR2KG_03225 [Nocardioidaceae bacterium]